MANLKNVDLSVQQQFDLDVFVREMLKRGWQTSATFGALFEQGWAVPYQAEFSLKKKAASLIARYVCGAEGTGDIVNLTLHTRTDNQMIALNFDRLELEVLRQFIGRVEALPAQDVRQILEAVVATDLEITINIYDDYHPLDAARLQQLYDR